MPPAVWISAAVVGAVIGFVLGRRARSRRPQAVAAFASEREEQLAKRVAARARCSVADALPAVRHELGLSPNQTDDTLVKRAVYHYQMSLPERPCAAYRDSVKG